MRKPERRIQRSNIKSSVLTYQLQACKERSGVEAVLLTSQEGFLVASSEGQDHLGESIAASLCQVQPHQFRIASIRQETRTKTIAARGFQFGEQALVVSAVGCPTENTVKELYTAMGGIQRILAS